MTIHVYLVEVFGLYSDFHRFQEFLNHMEKASQLQCTKDVQMLGVPGYETVRPLSIPHLLRQRTFIFE